MHIIKQVFSCSPLQDQFTKDDQLTLSTNDDMFGEVTTNHNTFCSNVQKI